MYARCVLAIGILGLSFGGAYWAGLAARNAKQSPQMEVVEGLSVASADLDLGEVWEEQGIVGGCRSATSAAGGSRYRIFSRHAAAPTSSRAACPSLPERRRPST